MRQYRETDLVKRPFSKGLLDIEVYSGQRVSAVNFDVDGRIVCGEAKRAPGDPWLEGAGVEIAMARAFYTAAHYLADKHNVAL